MVPCRILPLLFCEDRRKLQHPPVIVGGVVMGMWMVVVVVVMMMRWSVCEGHVPSSVSPRVPRWVNIIADNNNSIVIVAVIVGCRR